MSTWLTRSGAILACVAGTLSVPAAALDYQLHGFAAQGLVNSEGNDYYGDSTRTSLDYYEAGLNGSANLGYGLLLAAQGMARDAGATDDGHLRLDYALLDYQFIDSAAANGGIRLGRVKNPFGFYNDARDVVFTRPGILMPQLYFESAGIRSLLFSSDGGQLYGNAAVGDHEVSAALSIARNRHLSDIEKRQLGGSDVFDDVHIEVEDLRSAKLQDEFDGGRVKLALSYIGATLRVHGETPFVGTLDADFYVLSARYDAARFSLISEYALIKTKSALPGLGMTERNTGDSLYVQADWRCTPEWTLYLRHDMNFGDRGDRNGREAETETGADRHTKFSHDSVLGVNWRYDTHWGVWLEGHLIDGSGSVPLADNPDPAREAHWSLFAAMIGYRF